MVRDCCTLAQEFFILYPFFWFFSEKRFDSLTAALSLLTLYPAVRAPSQNHHKQITLALVGPPCINAQNILWRLQSVPKMCLSDR